MGKKRIRYIDVARGIAIILMVLGHVLEVGTVGRDIIFSFHMPLFLIVSGYFFTDKGSLKNLFCKMVTKLLIPAFVILVFVDFINFLRWDTGIRSFMSSAAHQIFLFYSYRNDGEGVVWDYPYGTGVMWFISLIFLVKLLYFFVNKLTKGNVYENIAVSFVLAMGGYFISQNLSYWLPWSFDVALSGAVFFGIGHFLKVYSEEVKKNIHKRHFVGLLFYWVDMAYAGIWKYRTCCAFISSGIYFLYNCFFRHNDYFSGFISL